MIERVNRTTGCLNNIIWRMRDIEIEVKKPNFQNSRYANNNGSIKEKSGSCGKRIDEETIEENPRCIYKRCISEV